MYTSNHMKNLKKLKNSQTRDELKKIPIMTIVHIYENKNNIQSRDHF